MPGSQYPGVGHCGICDRAFLRRAILGTLGGLVSWRDLGARGDVADRPNTNEFRRGPAVRSEGGANVSSAAGVPDGRTGEAPHLYAVPRHLSVTTAQIEAHCRANLAACKVPRKR